jgi:hypothetical protein
MSAMAKSWRKRTAATHCGNKRCQKVQLQM